MEWGIVFGLLVLFGDLLFYFLEVVIVVEDWCFYSYFGVDFFGIVWVLIVNMEVGCVV